MRRVRSRSEWTWRHLFLGPASLVDGVVETFTLGFVAPAFTVKVAVWITKARLVIPLPEKEMTD